MLEHCQLEQEKRRDRHRGEERQVWSHISVSSVLAEAQTHSAETSRITDWGVLAFKGTFGPLWQSKPAVEK